MSQVSRARNPPAAALSYEAKILIFGFIGAWIAHAFWLTSVPMETLKTLFHEIGHAVVATLLGQPSIPAFDFMFGGGFTHIGDFHRVLAIVVASGFAYAAWRLQTNVALVTTISVAFVVWLIFVSKEWRRETVIASAGVVFELLLAATFLVMAIANIGWRKPEIERPIAALIAFFVQFDSWIFALRLIRDQDFLAWYEEGKGGALMNDLEVVALNLKIYLGLNTTTQSVAKLLFVFSFIPFGAALWLGFRLRSDD